MNFDWIMGTTEARINHFLKNNELDIPEHLQGSVFKVTLPIPTFAPISPDVYCYLLPQRVIINQHALHNTLQQADVDIDIGLDALIGMSKGEKLASLLLAKKMEMRGDINKAQALQHWLESLALTKEDIFAELFGDHLAQIISMLEQQTRPAINAAIELGKSIVEQVSTTFQHRTPHDDSETLKQQILKLREQNERLEAHMHELQAQINAHSDKVKT